MGYEIKMIIGRSSENVTTEYEQDLDRPYEDGSGFHHKQDENGKPIETGRKLVWFQEYASVKLAKLGYQEDTFNAIISKSFEMAKKDPNRVHFFYDEDGNREVTVDRYEAFMSPILIADVLEAVNGLSAEAMEYRRLRWAKTLLDVMVDEPEGLSVMFYGY